MILGKERVTRAEHVVLHHLHALPRRRKRELIHVLDRIVHAVIERELLWISVLADVVRHICRNLRRKLVARTRLRLEIDEIARVKLVVCRTRADIAREGHILNLLLEEVADTARKCGIAARRLITRSAVEDKRILNVACVLPKRLLLLTCKLILGRILLRMLALCICHTTRADEVLTAVVPLRERADLIGRIVRHLVVSVLLRRFESIRRPVELKARRVLRLPEIGQEKCHVRFNARNNFAEIVLCADRLVRCGLRHRLCYQWHK